MSDYFQLLYVLSVEVNQPYLVQKRTECPLEEIICPHQEI